MMLNTLEFKNFKQVTDKEFKESCPKGIDLNLYIYGSFWSGTKKDGQFIFRDHVSMNCYSVSLEHLKEVYDSLCFLVKSEVFIKAGFYDRSLNTVIYDPIDKKEFIFGPFTFETLDELRKIVLGFTEDEKEKIQKSFDLFEKMIDKTIYTIKEENATDRSDIQK